MSIPPNRSSKLNGLEKKDDRSRLKIFFDIYTSKFSNIVFLNSMNTLLNLPTIFIAFLLSSYFFTNDVELLSLNYYIGYIIISLLVCIPLITIGPFQAGFTYVLRNFAREEHTFILSDFIKHSKKNLKQSLIVSLIDIAVTSVLLFEINYFSTQAGILGIAVYCLVLFEFVVFSIMHMYIYQIMVTVNLTVLQIYKNAFIFTIMNLLKSLFVYLLCLGIIILLSLFLPIGILGFAFLSSATIGLIINYHAHTTVKKYLINPY